MDLTNLIGYLTALGVGLLMGTERERSHDGMAPAGVRTFTLVALLGAIVADFESMPALLTFGFVIGLFAALAYRAGSKESPGLTTEVALVIAYVLGALAMSRGALAGLLGVVVTILLASRPALHEFVRTRLTNDEVRDGLVLLASVLIVLPLLPDRTIDPWGVLNPRLIFMLAVLFMAINAAGYIALRALGPTRGLALAGLLSGFVSSTATHSAMGTRAKSHPAEQRAAVAGAALSSIATVIQLAVLLALTSLPLLRALAVPLLCSGLVATVYGGLFMWRAARESGKRAKENPGRAFNPLSALAFAALIGAVIVGSALLVRWLGPKGAVVGAALSGFADAHAGAVSAGSLLRVDAVGLRTASLAVLAAFSTNAITKCIVATTSGGPGFALRLAPGLVLMTAAAWLGVAAEHLAD